ncbi:hypothetical protein [Hymenobacter armeniacus]|uniref:PH domain-containing protein n=1 Tax=Hymenobacter armeniacus TaxID=2771358 RepID=A0ABR8JXX5_9BACT|nr:hypothetical protein [Hymenobacter armeniacus]MBD2723646.1 hypothetical protein [Hymenobacter armeniacus]
MPIPAQIQSSWLRLGLLNLGWLGALGALLGCFPWLRAVPGAAGLGGLSIVTVAGLTLRLAVRISVSNGLLAICYPYRLPRKTFLLLAEEIRSWQVERGVPTALLFYVDERRIRLPCCGLPPAALAHLKTQLEGNAKICPAVCPASSGQNDGGKPQKPK